MRMHLVCFDMDGTLIRNTDSVRYLCSLNGKARQLDDIERLEREQRATWIEADYRRAKLVAGLKTARVESEFDKHVRLIANIETVLSYLQENRIRAALVTAGPEQVADVLKKRFNFDDVRASRYEVENGRFTGNILTHLGTNGKNRAVEEMCSGYGVGLDRCIAVGDGESDIEMFRVCAKSIAINYSSALEGKASEYINTEDLSDILGTLRSWISE